MRWNYRSTQTKREYWLSMVGLAVKSFESGRNYRVSNTIFCHWCGLHVRKRKITKHSNSVTRQRQPLISKPQYFRDFGRERNCSVSNLASVDNHEWPPYCKEAKWHGTQTTGGTGTIFEGKWNCTMLKQSLFQGFRVAGLKREHYVVFKPDFFDVSMDFRFGKVWSCRVLKRQDEPQRCKKAKLQDTQIRYGKQL